MQCMHASTYFDSPRLTYSTEEQMHLHALIFIQDPTFIQVLPFTSSLQALAFIHSKKTPPLFIPSLSTHSSLFRCSKSFHVSQALPFIPSSYIHSKLFHLYQPGPPICSKFSHSFQALPFIPRSSQAPSSSFLHIHPELLHLLHAPPLISSSSIYYKLLHSIHSSQVLQLLTTTIPHCASAHNKQYSTRPDGLA